MFGIGTGEILLILVIAMLVVGPERMVEFAGQVGRLIAKFRQQSASVTQEFREAFSLEELEASATSGAQGVATTQAGDGSPAEAAPAELSAEPEQGIAGATEPPTPVYTAFADTEIEVAAAGVSLDAGALDTAGPVEGENIEPMVINVGEFVPKDEEVQPTIIEETVLIVDEESSVDSDRPQAEG